MNQLLKRFTQFSAGTFLGALLSIVQIPILTYFILPEEYGRAGLFNSLILQVPLFLYLGLDQAFSREYNDANNKNKLLINSIIVPLLNSVLFSMFAIFFDERLSLWLFDSTEYVYLIWLGALTIVLIIFERFILLNVRMAEKAKEFSFYTLLIKVLIFIITLSLLMLGNRSFQVITLGLLFGHYLGNIILIFRYRKFFIIENFDMDLKLILRMLMFGIPQMVAVTLISGLNVMGNIFLNTYSHSSELGLYNLSLSIVSIIGIMQTVFSTFWLPTAYRWEKNKKTLKHFQFISDFVLLLLTIAFYSLILLLPLIPFFVGNSYTDVVIIIPILTLPHILATLSETTTLGILFSKKTYLNIIVSILTFITSLIVNILLTPIFGYRGTSVAIALAYFIYYLSRTYLSMKTGFYFSQLKQIITIIIMIVISVAIVFGMKFTFETILIPMFVSIYIQKTTISNAIDIKTGNDWNFD